ncbi:methylated-DNA-[protein]-cysteine S-methyltransferase [Antricoccus suffuscus]|uniref:Methylated-DNA--protein-cysteine methyltransferase n=1 Tax=Antricoccus suffuscus TaxID=1629062 RepID=A0A2T1A398_9ACTN|nr:methylated-DNA--[protein]-cysteine S-methyltransferase [Antricoccus suffuscus]PRZ42798.1 methylated-DNA-[protein]-cysteine S-methyltransferase [Antricoccus suffuscus]
MFDRHATITTAIGDLTLVAADDALIGIYFPHHWVGAARASRGAEVAADNDPVLSVAAAQLREYLAGERSDFTIKTAAEGDEFQQRVWAILHEIPSGETTTYGAIAAQLGDKSLARMVGKAVGSNPLSIVVPCHRVVGADGKLTGYAGGLERKQHLLNLEGALPAQAEALF